MTDVQKLVHLTMRQTVDDADRVRSELLKQRRTWYESELTAQAQRVGCNRVGRLGNNEILSGLNDESRADAESITNTYNYDLAAAILNIAAEVPTANRFTYAKRLGDWEAKRAGWKNEQIATFTEVSARSRAQQDFYTYNAIFGTARLEPRAAVCPVCQGWVRRGNVPIKVAMNNPPPYHPSCPHWFKTNPEKVDRTDCPNLWMGA